MDDITRREPRKITAEDINPRYNWGRHLPVLGTMASGLQGNELGKFEESDREVRLVLGDRDPADDGHRRDQRVFQS